ncbi:MAG: hypothetical protein JXB48_23360 [Candidatus Latescibacteria bacterium]|nr:hypothetical protein [Candidatus Latescibacterota bacterium]
MQRCIKCLLPSCLPGSEFDKNGECSWCRSGYPNYQPKGTEKLEEFLLPYRKSAGAADCLLGISGGKDSSYALLQMVKSFGMKAEAFTYNHDGMADFALRNATAVCKSLGVRHHIVSLQPQVHMRSFRRFFRAWVKHPSNIAAGLTCVACKHLHILGAELATKRNIPLIVWSNCPLEYAPYIALKLENRNNNQLNRGGLFEGGLLLVKQILSSKELLQSFISDFRISIPGCMAFSPNTVYLKFRFPNLKHLFFYDYIGWNPSAIVDALENNVGWKKPKDICDDWHSDCVFNVFKEYMFQNLLHASYTDSFLSSQIRHGILSREAALQKLLQSKRFYQQALYHAMEFTGLTDLKHEIDLSCFDTKE